MDWEQAVAAVARTHGTPLRVEIEVPAHAAGGFAGPREAEVCMVLRDGERFAVMTKPYYPSEIWRLPTGGIENGEGVIEAFARELMEETGLASDAPRFMAHVAYEVEGTAAFHTFAFLVEWDGAPLVSNDPSEAMTFSTATLESLEAQAERMARLAPGWSEDLQQDWAGWGWQRAIMQRAVIEGLGGLR